MRLVSLDIENVRKFRRAHRIEAFGARLNVLCGPNEFGKSTLLAALSAAFFQRHTARTATTRALQTLGSETAPRIGVSFALGNAVWRLEKRFLLRPSARLTGPDGRQFEGDAAENRLRSLLGFEGGGKPEHLGLWDALWVGQGASFSQASVEGGLARGTLAECLEAELGGVAGFGRGDALWRKVDALSAAMTDPNGRPKGERRVLAGEHEEAVRRVAELESRRARLAEDLEALDALGGRRDALRAEIGRGGERAEIATAREMLARADRLASEIEAAREALGTRVVEHRDTRRAIEGRDAEGREEVTLRAEATEREARSRECAAASEAAEAAWRQARDALERGEAEATAADGAVQAARRAAEGAEIRARLDGRTQRLERARVIEAEVAALEAQVAAMAVDAARLDGLRSVARDVAAHRDRLEAQAPWVELRLVAAAPAVRWAVAGREEGAAPAGFAAVEETDLLIEGVGTIRIRPPAAASEATRRKLADGERRLRAELAGAGVADLEAAEAAFRERARAAAGLDERRQALARLVPGDEASGLAPGVAALAAEVERLRAVVAEAGPPPDGEGAGELSERLGAAEGRRREAMDRLQPARVAHEAASKRLGERKVEAARALAAAEAALTRAVAVGAALAQAERLWPRALLDVAAAAAAAAEREAAERLARLEGDERGDATWLRARIARLEEAIDERDRENQRVGEQLARVRERVDREGGAGIDEQLAAAEREADMLGRRVAALNREAEAWTLLDRTLRETVGAARAATMRPLTERIVPRLALMLPGARIECDDDFRITTVARGGGLAEPFGNLSDGTREQIAVLARLAYAEMLIERGRPAMVVLDDALAFSDRQRIERMFDILAEAALRVQVLVLTCREDLFGRLGGRRLRLEPVDA